MNGFSLLPPTASVQAEKLDTLFLVLVGVGGAALLAIAVLVIFFSIRYRRGSVVNRRGELNVRLLEYTWTITPLLLFLGSFVWGARLYVDEHAAPADALLIHGIGKQWMWQFEHPGGQREINELHVPLGRPVEVVLASQDVIHSFFVPAFRVKQDAVPGHVTSVWFTATAVGDYHLFCAEYCGTNHSGMRGHVSVLPPDAYQAWLEAHTPALSLVQRGAQLYASLGCGSCHDEGSTVDAPPLAGLFGRAVALQGGASAIADEQYLRSALLRPNQQITAGYEAIMPTYANQLDEEQLVPLLMYLESLGPDGAGG